MAWDYDGYIRTKMEKNGKSFIRKLNPDKEFFDKEDKKVICMEDLFYYKKRWSFMTSQQLFLMMALKFPKVLWMLL